MQWKLALLDFLSGSRIYTIYDELSRSQWWTGSELSRRQAENLRALLSHAGKNVPFYCAAFAGADMKRPDAFGMLASLPILSRRLLQEHARDLLAEKLDPRKHRLVSSSGTTGAVVKVYIDDMAKDYSRALEKRGEFEWTEANFFAKRVTFTNRKTDPKNLPRQLWNHVRLIWRFPTVGETGRFQDDAGLKPCIDALYAIRPVIIRGMASGLQRVAEYLLKNNLEQIRPQTIISNSEPLTAEARKLLEKAFGARVYNQYGLAECGTVASECPHGRMHINAERFIVEILRDGLPVPPGEEGEITLTDLKNYSFPLIRYGTGDLGVLAKERCTCGRELPVLEKVSGRTVDLIDVPVGESIPVTQLDHIFGVMPYEQIKQVQLYQPSRDRLILRLVKGQDYRDESAEKVRELLTKYFKDSGMEITLDFLDHLPVSRAGKLQFYVCGYDRGREEV